MQLLWEVELRALNPHTVYHTCLSVFLEQQSPFQSHTVVHENDGVCNHFCCHLLTCLALTKQKNQPQNTQFDYTFLFVVCIFLVPAFHPVSEVEVVTFQDPRKKIKSKEIPAPVKVSVSLLDFFWLLISENGEGEKSQLKFWMIKGFNFGIYVCTEKPSSLDPLRQHAVWSVCTVTAQCLQGWAFKAPDTLCRRGDNYLFVYLLFMVLFSHFYSRQPLSLSLCPLSCFPLLWSPAIPAPRTIRQPRWSETKSLRKWTWKRFKSHPSYYCAFQSSVV